MKFKMNYVRFPIVLFAFTVLLSGCANKVADIQSSNEKVNTASTAWDKVTDSDFDYKYDSKLQGVEVRYKGSASKVRFPDKINGDPVVSIGATKTSKSLVAVDIPNSVKLLDTDAFADCSNLTSVTIPDSVTEIGSNAFGCCKNLTSLNIPNSVTIIGDAAFGACAELTKVIIPASVTSIGRGAFANCEKLATISLPDTVCKMEIKSDAFDSTYWYNKQPDGFICIGNTVLGYKGKNDVAITIPDGMERISDWAFSTASCGNDWGKLKSVSIPNSVTKIGDSTFRGCTLLDETTKSRIKQINSKAYVLK